MDKFDMFLQNLDELLANLAESRDELVTENRTLRDIIHGLHKQPCICWVCERQNALLKSSPQKGVERRCVLCDKPLASDYLHASCEDCIKAGKLI
jgi:hypothetical protein